MSIKPTKNRKDNYSRLMRENPNFAPPWAWQNTPQHLNNSVHWNSASNILGEKAFSYGSTTADAALALAPTIMDVLTGVM